VSLPTDQPFALDEATHGRLRRRFDAELSWWGTAADLHLIAIATFGISVGGLPAIEALSLMPVTAQWLPVDDGFEHQLVERLVSEGRRFVKPLRYNLPVGQPLASAIPTDARESPIALNVHRPGDSSRLESAARNQTSAPPDWHWSVEEGAMPALPRKAETVANRAHAV
jgi:hypothetical protein